MSGDTKAPPPTPIDLAIDKIAVAIHAWQEQQTDGLKEKVIARLDQSRDEVLMKLMGFTKSSWRNQEWAIDHCNGRSGESTAGKLFKDLQEEAIKEWLSQIQLPTMTPKFKASIEKQMRQTYETELNRMVWEMAEKQAADDMSSLLETLFKPTRVELYQRAMALINSPTTTV